MAHTAAFDDKSRIGLFVCSGNTFSSTTAVFDSVTVTALRAAFSARAEDSLDIGFQYQGGDLGRVIPTSGAGLEKGRDFGRVVGRGKGLVGGCGGLIA
jgi:hypothetical protein